MCLSPAGYVCTVTPHGAPIALHMLPPPLVDTHTSARLPRRWVSECVAQDQKARINDGIVFLF